MNEWMNERNESLKGLKNQVNFPESIKAQNWKKMKNGGKKIGPV